MLGGVTYHATDWCRAKYAEMEMVERSRAAVIMPVILQQTQAYQDFPKVRTQGDTAFLVTKAVRSLRRHRLSSVCAAL